MLKPIVIAIHGVGEAVAADTLKGIASNLPNSTYARSDLVIGSVTYPRLIGDSESVPDLIEVNWSDVQRPRSSVLGVISHLMRLGAGLPMTIFDWLPRAAPAQMLRGAYRHVFHAAFLWVTFPVLLCLVHLALRPKDALAAVALELGLLLVMWLLSALASPAGPAFRRASIAWLILSVLLVATLWSMPSLLSPLAVLFARLYGLAQVTAAVLLISVAIHLASNALRKRCTWKVTLSALALEYVPLALISAIGSLIWVAALLLLRQTTPAPWQQLFLSNLGFDLAGAEWGMAAATVAAAGYVAFVLVRYFVTRRGSVAHRGLGQMLGVMPVIFSVPAFLMLATSPYLGAPLSLDWSSDLLTIYSLSALRVGPWLLLLATPVSTVLDILGDVGFYLIPGDKTLSSRAPCQTRVTVLLDHLAATDGRTIHVKGVTLTTMGSPLGTLYLPYLAWPVKGKPSCVGSWKNLYRKGDYVGGPVGLAEVDEQIGTGGHMDYWLEPALAERVLIMAAPMPLAQF